MRASEDVQTLIRVKEILGEHARKDLDADMTDSLLGKQQGFLRDVTTGSPKWERINLSRLIEKEEVLADWCRGTKSSLLTLSGRNGSKVHSQNSWLSPAIVELIQMSLNEKQIVAYHFCRSEGNHIAALSDILCQLLEHDQSVLRRCRILPILESGFRHNQDENTQLNSVKSALTAIVKEVPGPVRIVLDRPELLGDGEDVESIMDTIFEAVRQAGPERLKVLMCINAGRWKVEPWISRRRSKEGGEILSHIRLDQNPRR